MDYLVGGANMSLFSICPLSAGGGKNQCVCDAGATYCPKYCWQVCNFLCSGYVCVSRSCPGKSIVEPFSI